MSSKASIVLVSFMLCQYLHVPGTSPAYFHLRVFVPSAWNNLPRPSSGPIPLFTQTFTQTSPITDGFPDHYLK